MILRPERPQDREASIRVEREAFGSDAEAAIVEAVRDEEGSFALVAEDGGGIVGHAQLARADVGGDPVPRDLQGEVRWHAAFGCDVDGVRGGF